MFQSVLAPGLCKGWGTVMHSQIAGTVMARTVQDRGWAGSSCSRPLLHIPLSLPNPVSLAEGKMESRKPDPCSGERLSGAILETLTCPKFYGAQHSTTQGNGARLALSVKASVLFSSCAVLNLQSLLEQLRTRKSVAA